MPNKTIYIKDTDEKIWQEAEELVKLKIIDSLSGLVIDSIRKEISRLKKLEDLKEGLERIVIKVRNENGTRKVAFNGRWLVKDYEYWNGSRNLSIALTEKESYLAFYDNPMDDYDGYEVFNYFEDLTNSETIPEELKGMVAEEVGEDYVEFLDI